MNYGAWKCGIMENCVITGLRCVILVRDTHVVISTIELDFWDLRDSRLSWCSNLNISEGKVYHSSNVITYRRKLNSHSFIATIFSPDSSNDFSQWSSYVTRDTWRMTRFSWYNNNNNNDKEESYRLEISNEKRNAFPYIFLRNSPITLIL